jgi:EmrB/QacA subfamily drug resistance transporter
MDSLSQMANPIAIPEYAASRRSLAVAFLVAGAFFMENLDGTVIATALPQMARSFRVSAVDLNIGMTAYMLTLAVFIPISGWVADRLGARVVFSTAISVFTFSSILCGLSNGLWEFTAARILQGIGGSMMVPVGRLVVLRVTEKKDLLRSMAYITWPGLVAPILGPPLGGFITTYSSWRWIFFLNVPLGLIAFVLAIWWIKNERGEVLRPFDWLGFALAGTACTTFMYSLELLGRRDAGWTGVASFFGFSLFTGWLALRHMRHSQHPLIDFGCLKVKTFQITIYGGSLFRIAINASPFLLPLMFQIPFGMTAFQSGLLLLAMFAGNLSMKGASIWVVRRYGFRKVLTVNGVISALLVLGCGLPTPRTATVVIAALLFLHGLSRSMQFTALVSLGFADIPKPLMSSATSFSSVMIQMAMGMGVAIGAVALRAAAFLSGHRGPTPTLMDFHIAFALIAVIALVAVVDTFTLDPHAGAEVSGHRPN